LEARTAGEGSAPGDEAGEWRTARLATAGAAVVTPLAPAAGGCVRTEGGGDGCG
jgi:hypothetical protein